jgi:hypothetical protein
MLLLCKKEQDMGHELWAELSAVISLVDRDFVDNPDTFYTTATVVRCHLWSALHERPTCWACHASNWDRRTRPRQLPGQSTLSRRLRTDDFEQFMLELERRLRHLPGMGTLFKRLDAKALIVAAHSKDPHARFGHASGGRTARGYKLHLFHDGGAMPHRWRVAALDKSEQEMARRMLRELTSPGLVIADAGYDGNPLYAAAAQAGHRLIAARCRPGKAPGHRPQHPDRLRALRAGPMHEQALRDRGQIERDLGNLTSFGGGLSGLPAWARTHGRVRRWVWAKLMINAARIRLLHRRKSGMCA